MGGQEPCSRPPAVSALLAAAGCPGPGFWAQSLLNFGVNEEWNEVGVLIQPGGTKRYVRLKISLLVKAPLWQNTMLECLFS